MKKKSISDQCLVKSHFENLKRNKLTHRENCFKRSKSDEKIDKSIEESSGALHTFPLRAYPQPAENESKMFKLFKFKKCHPSTCVYENKFKKNY